MSYPRSVHLFIPWSKAMVAGATVDKPNYGKSRGNQAHSNKQRMKKRKRRRRKRAKTKES